MITNEKVKCEDCGRNMDAMPKGRKRKYCDKCRTKRAQASSKRRNQAESKRVKEQKKQLRGPALKFCPACKKEQKKRDFIPHEGWFICGDCYRSDTDIVDYKDYLKRKHDPDASQTGCSLNEL